MELAVYNACNILRLIRRFCGQVVNVAAIQNKTVNFCKTVRAPSESESK